MVIGVRRWAVVATFATVISAGVGTCIGTWRSAPSAPKQCETLVSTRREPVDVRCTVGMKVTVERPTTPDGMWLFRCDCPVDERQQ